MRASRKGIAVVCDEQGRIVRWLRDDLALARRAPAGESWRQLLESASLTKAEAFVEAIYRHGAALDWQMDVIIDRQPAPLRFAGTRSGSGVTLLAFADTPAGPRHRRTDGDDRYAELGRLNNELVQMQRTLVHKNDELKQTNQQLGIIRARLEESQAELLAANQRLLAQACRDGLTGVHNRRAFQCRLYEEVERADRYGQPLSLALLDIDHFKQFNDTLGHVVGDDALRAVASAAQATVRGCDFVARHGGDTFAVILPSVVGENARQAGERLRQAVAHLPDLPLPLTVSLGLAAHGPLTPTVEELVRCAEQALDLAKQTGRDRVVTAWRVPSA